MKEMTKKTEASFRETASLEGKKKLHVLLLKFFLFASFPDSYALQTKALLSKIIPQHTLFQLWMAGMLLQVCRKKWHFLIVVPNFCARDHERAGTCFVLLTWYVFSWVSKSKIIVNSSSFHHDCKSVTCVTRFSCHKVTPLLAVHPWRAETI